MLRAMIVRIHGRAAMGEFIDKAKGAANEALGKAKGGLGNTI